jgi:hypothetical protein
MEENNREKSLIKNAEALSRNLGFAKENTNIVEIRKTDDPSHKIIINPTG